MEENTYQHKCPICGECLLPEELYCSICDHKCPVCYSYVENMEDIYCTECLQTPHESDSLDDLDEYLESSEEGNCILCNKISIPSPSPFANTQSQSESIAMHQRYPP